MDGVPEAVAAVRADRDQREAAGLDRSATGKHLRGLDIAADLRAAAPILRKHWEEQQEKLIESDAMAEYICDWMHFGAGNFNEVKNLLVGVGEALTSDRADLEAAIDATKGGEG